MEKMLLELENFEGPLDLLLHLIKKLEIDIYDIPIAQITDQYLAYINSMQELQLEVAGEFIVMASQLMAIKSKMLLPTETYEGEDEEYELLPEDPREALVKQLIEYKRFKKVSAILHELEEERSLYFTKEPMNVDDYKEDDTKLDPNQYNTIDLFLAFHQMLANRHEKKPIQTTIESETVSIEERMEQIVYRLAESFKNGKRQLLFDELFEKDYTKSELVTTFIAVLELMKKKQVRIEQEENFTPITLTFIET